jgi:hypothetical protein
MGEQVLLTVLMTREYHSAGLSKKKTRNLNLSIGYARTQLNGYRRLQRSFMVSAQGCCKAVPDSKS